MARILDLEIIEPDAGLEQVVRNLLTNTELLQQVIDSVLGDQKENWSPVAKDGLQSVEGNLHVVKGELRISSNDTRAVNEGGIRRTYGDVGAWLEYSHDGKTWYKFAKGTPAAGAVTVYSGGIPVYTVPSVGVALAYRTVTAATTIVAGDDIIRVNAVGGDITVTLPSPSAIDSAVYYIKKIDATANKVTVDAGAFDIDGASTVDLTIPQQVVCVHSISSKWELLVGYP